MPFPTISCTPAADAARYTRKSLKYLAKNEYLALFTLPLAYLAGGPPNFTSGYEAGKKFLLWLKEQGLPMGEGVPGGMAIVVGTFSAVYNVVLYFYSLRRVACPNVLVFAKDWLSFMRDRQFFSRGVVGYADGLATLLIGFSMFLSASGTAAITYNALVAAGKSVFLETMASFFANACLNIVATGAALSTLFRSVDTGISIVRVRKLADDVCNLSTEQLYQVFLDHSEDFLDEKLKKQALIQAMRGYHDLFSNSGRHIKADMHALHSLEQLDKRIVAIKRIHDATYTSEMQKPGVGYLIGRYLGISMVATDAAYIAFLNAGSVKEGLELLFKLMGVNSPIATWATLPAAEAARIALFIMSGLNVTQGLGNIWIHLKNMYKVKPVFALTMAAVFLVELFGGLCSGSTFANAMLESFFASGFYKMLVDLDATSIGNIVGGVIGGNSDLLSATINLNRILSLTLYFFQLVQARLWPAPAITEIPSETVANEGINDAQLDQHVDIVANEDINDAQLDQYIGLGALDVRMAMYGFTDTLGSGFYRHLIEKNTQDEETDSVAKRCEGLASHMTPNVDSAASSVRPLQSISRLLTFQSNNASHPEDSDSDGYPSDLENERQPLFSQGGSGLFSGPPRSSRSRCSFEGLACQVL